MSDVRSRCRSCAAPIPYAGKGRVRKHCTKCRPAGAPKPRGIFGALLARNERSRLTTAARGAAYRRCAFAHPEDFRRFYDEERAKRGVL